MVDRTARRAHGHGAHRSVSALTDHTLRVDELGRIAQAMQARVDLAGPLSAELITGGRSNLTYLLTDGARRWVMRTPPRVGRTPSAHDVAREFRVTAALGPTDVPVPPAVVLCEDESLIGGPFAIAEFVEGRCIQTSEQLAELDDAAVAATTTSLISVLVALHRVDHVAIGLETFDRPEGYAQRQLKRWSGQWELVADPSIAPRGMEMADQLRAKLPDAGAVGIVHGDYRIDNTILACAELPRVAAVVDWELWTIGDPVADVAMMCAYRASAFDLVVGSAAAWTSDRLPDVDGLAAAYEAAGGVELVAWEFHLSLAYYKVAVIAAGIAHRARLAGRSLPGFAAAGEAVEPYLELSARTLAAV